MNAIEKQTQEFREKLAQLNREELLEIIKSQNPDLIMGIERIEWVFANRLRHLTWKNGQPITGRILTNEELILLIDEPFRFNEKLSELGMNAEQQKNLHIAKDSVAWSRAFLKDQHGNSFKPRVYQILMLRQPSRFKILRAGRRLGKALHVDTPIPTPDGWKKMGEIQEGDKVFDESGQPCNVTFATDYQYDRECFKVHFSDGSSITADADHQWTVDTKSSRKARGRAKNPVSKPITITIKDMIDNLYVSYGGKLEVNYSIDVAGPVRYPDKELPIDPWLFGLWLADGRSCGGQITIGKEDQEEILSIIKDSGNDYIRRKNPIEFGIPGLYSKLDDLSVLKKYSKPSYWKYTDESRWDGKYSQDNKITKFIPRQYLEGSIEQRMALLQGLMDGDGTALKNSNCEFSVTNYQLARDAFELIQSLGFRATFRTENATVEGRIVGLRYRINFTPWKPVFRLKRKLARQNLRNEPSARQRCRYIVAIESVDSVPVKCIEVDSDSHLYLAGESFIPTHNTTTLAILALHYSFTTNGGKTIVVTPMLTQAKLIYDEIMKWAKASDIVQESITRNVLNPQAEIMFSNDSTIRLFTSGMKTGSKADITRGQEAHLIILDELDYMGDDDLEALYAMMTDTGDNLSEKRMIGASTPSGKQAVFYRWCTDPKSYFKEFWYPSYVNPYWTKETEDFLRQEHGANGYRREVEADWGEPVDGVYPKRYLDRAFVWNKDNKGRDVAPWEYLASRDDEYSTYVMGVDWDKNGAGVNLVVLQYFNHQLSPPEWKNKIKLCYREETARDEYTLTKAVHRIIELHETFRFKHIYVDRGYGEQQLEQLKLYGINHSSSDLHKVVKGFTFSDAIEVRDPFTMHKVKKEIKPFMVDNLRLFLERDQILFPGQDEELKMSLINYVVARQTSSGREVYEMTGGSPDHAHDALILACLAITQNYGDLMRTNYATQAHAISNNAFLQIVKPDKPNAEPKDEVKSLQSGPVALSRPMSYSGRRSSKSRPIRRKSF